MANEIKSTLVLSGSPEDALRALEQVNKGAQSLTKSVVQVGAVSEQAGGQMVDALKDAETAAERARDPVDEMVASVKELTALTDDTKKTDEKSAAKGISAFKNVLGSVDNAALDASMNIADMVTQTASLGPQVAIAAAALLAFTQLMTVLNKQQSESTKGLRDLISRTDEYYTLLQTGSTKSVEDAINAKKEELAIAEAKMADLQAVYDASKTTAGSLVTEFSRVAQIVGREYKDILDAVSVADATAKDIAALKKEIEGLESVIGTTNVVANDMQIELDEIAEKEKELAEQRERHRETIEQLRQQEADLVAEYQARLRLQAEDRALREQRKQEDDALQSEFETRKAELDALFAAEDSADAALKRQSDYTAKLVEIEAQGQQKIADLRQQLVDRTAQTFDRIAGVTKTYNENREKLEQEYARQSLKRQQEYERRRADIENAFNITRLQAYANQDALGLFFATLNKNLALEGVDADKQVADADAKENFKRRKQEDKKAFEERLVAMQMELDAFKQGIEQKIVAEQEAIAKRLDAEKESFDAREKLLADEDERRTARETAYQDLQDKLDTDRRDILLRRDAEDLAIREQREQDALEKAKAKIQEKANAEVAALDSLIAKSAQLKAIADSIQFGFGGTAGPNLASPKPLPTGTPKAFATGAIFDKPTLIKNGVFGEQEPEYLIPKSKLSGMGGMSVSMPVTVNVATTEGMTGSDIPKAIADAIKREGETLINAIVEMERKRGRPK
jgi:hypothetical protein